MKLQKHFINIFVTLFLLNLVHAQDNIEQEQPEIIILTPGPITGKYDNDDLDEIFDESSIEIQCSGTKCNSSSDNVLLEEGKVTISNSGTYILGGELNGQLNINATKEDIIHLILRNITISSDFGAAVYGKKCKKVIITTEGQNTISDSVNYPEDAITIEEEEEENDNEEEDEEEEEEETESIEIETKNSNACIYIKSDITFNGKGSLDVNANFNGGIKSKNNIKIVSGKMNITSKGDSIKAKKSISIKDGEINIDSGKSALKVTKDTDPEEGFVVIDGGKLTIKTVQDAIHAETHLTINDGNIKVTESDEGFEAQMVDITGGDIYINATNDGINGSRMEARKNLKKERSDNDEQVYIRITGGKVDVRVEGNDLDAIDSNGSLLIGGNSEVYASVVYGGAFGHMAAIDSDGYKSIEANSTALITGSGNFPSMGGMPGGSKNGIKGSSMRNYWYDEPDSCSFLQPYVRATIDIQVEGTSVIIKDSNDEVIIDQKPRAQFGVIFFTSPEIVEGETYTITAGKITKEVIAKIDKE